MAKNKSFKLLENLHVFKGEISITAFENTANTIYHLATCHIQQPHNKVIRCYNEIGIRFCIRNKYVDNNVTIIFKYKNNKYELVGPLYKLLEQIFRLAPIDDNKLSFMNCIQKIPINTSIKRIEELANMTYKTAKELSYLLATNRKKRKMSREYVNRYETICSLKKIVVQFINCFGRCIPVRFNRLDIPNTTNYIFVLDNASSSFNNFVLDQLYV